MGEPMRHVGSLVSGVASISQALEDGRRQIMGVLLPSDFIGRPGRRQAQYDITAASEVVICRFEITAFENMLRVSPSLGPRLLEMTMDELDAVRDWMLLLGRKSAREKVATLIYHFAAKNRLLSGELDHQSWHFMLPLTREALADYLGLTIETVSRQMSALKKAGVIALQGQRVIVIPDFRLLQAETGDECNNDQLP
jgi:CRP/FNR family transcriptional regulator